MKEVRKILAIKMLLQCGKYFSKYIALEYKWKKMKEMEYR